GAELVDGILRRVPEDIVVAVVEVDKIGAGYAPLHKGNMIVLHSHSSCEKMRLIAKSCSGLIHHVFEPWSRVGIVLNIQIRIAHHICQQECLDLLQSSVSLPL